MISSRSLKKSKVTHLSKEKNRKLEEKNMNLKPNINHCSSNQAHLFQK
jgi:hypothetical protein